MERRAAIDATGINSGHSEFERIYASQQDGDRLRKVTGYRFGILSDRSPCAHMGSNLKLDHRKIDGELTGTGLAQRCGLTVSNDKF